MPGYVYDFAEAANETRDTLGGKGAALAEMTAIGLPVPDGFTISTQACRDYLRAGGVPEGLDAEVDAHLAAWSRGWESGWAIRPIRSWSRCGRARRSRCPG